jgi:predicted transposase/invertase (TIGR01784 family)
MWESLNNLYLSASLLLMKNIFKDVKELKPILKEIVTLDDDRVIRLFEYIVVNNDLKEEEFIEMVKEIKGDDKMSSLAQRWVDQGFENGVQQGIQTGIQQGIQSGVEKVSLGLLKANIDIKIISTTTGLSKKELEELRKKL